MRRSLYGLAAAVFFGTAALGGEAGEAGWQPYANARFGTAAEVPAGALTPLPPAENGDGQAWLSADGATGLRVFGAFWSAADESWDGYRQTWRRSLQEDGVIVTYAPEREDWFVFSGVKDGEVVYLRVERSARCPDIAHHMLITYPAAQKPARDPWTERLGHSLSETLTSLECR